MSLQLAVAKGAYMGDPGLFSFVGKALKGIASIGGKVVKTAVGAAAGLARGGPLGAITGGLSAAGVIKLPTQRQPVLLSPEMAYGRSTGMPGIGQQPIVQFGGRVGPVSGGFMIGGGGQPGAPSTYVAPDGTACRGHLNRTRYYSQRMGGLVEPGTVCVKNRRTNPLNPRALSRSMRRLSGFVKATRSAEKLLTRMARKAGGGRRSGCGGRCRKK